MAYGFTSAERLALTEQCRRTRARSVVVLERAKVVTQQCHATWMENWELRQEPKRRRTSA
jgi:ribonuclease HI